MKLLSAQKTSRGHIVPGGLKLSTSFKSAEFGKVKNYSKMILRYYSFKLLLLRVSAFRELNQPIL